MQPSGPSQAKIHKHKEKYTIIHLVGRKKKIYKYKEIYTQANTFLRPGRRPSPIESDIVVCPCILVLGQHKLLTFFLLVFSLKSTFSFRPAIVTT